MACGSTSGAWSWSRRDPWVSVLVFASMMAILLLLPLPVVRTLYDASPVVVRAVVASTLVAVIALLALWRAGGDVTRMGPQP